MTLTALLNLAWVRNAKTTVGDIGIDLSLITGCILIEHECWAAPILLILILPTILALAWQVRVVLTGWLHFAILVVLLLTLRRQVERQWSLQLVVHWDLSLVLHLSQIVGAGRLLQRKALFCRLTTSGSSRLLELFLLLEGLLVEGGLQIGRCGRNQILIRLDHYN